MRGRAGFLVVPLFAAFFANATVGSAETLPPSSWPNTSTTKPSIDGWPHALRIFGSDRYQTGLSAALMMRGAGGVSSYPFGSPDPATASGWWGLGTCPRAIIIAAGDNPADALVASSLSDSTGQSSEPRLQRSAAADPLFDPVGGFQKVDTDFAPILITRSARQGATSLDLATRLAAQDLRSGGCTTARQAIVVGGTSSIPSSVDTELVAIGYEQVFRVAGASRYDTAKLVAESLGTAAAAGSPTPTTCVDPLTDDGNARMNFYANSVVELRDSAQQCRLLSRTVVIADGLTGVDALAAGWWTSFWQVPILLHNGSDSLPAATAQALQTLRVDNVIVLGGTSRVSDSVVAQVSSSTNGANVVRVAGSDRYATSVEMARKFGGWYATGRGTEFAGSMVCIAASSGGTANTPGTGWADALSAGPWCGRANGAAANPKTPVRALTPTTGRSPTISAAVAPIARPAHDAVPVLLVPAGGSSLPASVEGLLGSSFDPSDNWCTSVAATSGCLAPGFAMVFGGSASVADAQVDATSRLVSGGKSAGASDRTPRLGGGFVTSLDMSPVFDDPSATSSASGLNRICFERDGYDGARWLVVAGGTTSNSLDVMSRGRYVSDADGASRSAGLGSPVCVGVPADAATGALSRAVSLAGPASTPLSTPVSAANRFVVSSTISASSPQSSSGVSSELDASNGGSTNWTFASSAGVSATSRGVNSPLSSSTLVVTLVRGGNTATQTGVDAFSGTFALVSALGTVTGTVSGEAILSGGSWRLRGRATFGPGTWNIGGGSGGFVADIGIAGPGTLADDSVIWRIDGSAS
jgi:putative cell wall-binding protein